MKHWPENGYGLNTLGRNHYGGYFNPFVPNVPFLNPLKISENLRDI